MKTFWTNFAERMTTVFRFWLGENFRESQNNFLWASLAVYRTTFQLLWKRGNTKVFQSGRHVFDRSDQLQDQNSEARGKKVWNALLDEFALMTDVWPDFEPGIVKVMRGESLTQLDEAAVTVSEKSEVCSFVAENTPDFAKEVFRNS